MSTVSSLCTCSFWSLQRHFFNHILLVSSYLCFALLFLCCNGIQGPSQHKTDEREKRSAIFFPLLVVILQICKFFALVVMMYFSKWRDCLTVLSQRMVPDDTEREVSVLVIVLCCHGYCPHLHRLQCTCSSSSSVVVKQVKTPVNKQSPDSVSSGRQDIFRCLRTPVLLPCK